MSSCVVQHEHTGSKVLFMQFAFHLKCTKNSERNIQCMNRKNTFRCELCKDKSSASVSYNGDRHFIFGAIFKLGSKVNAKLEDIQMEILDMRKDFTQLKLTITALHADNSMLKE